MHVHKSQSTPFIISTHTGFCTEQFTSSDSCCISAWLDFIYLTGWQPKQVAFQKFLGRTRFAVPLLRSPDFVVKVVCFMCSDLLQRCSKWEVIKEGNFQINTLPPQNKSMILWIYLGLHLSCGLVLLFFGKGPHSPHDPVTSSDSFALNGSLAPVPRLLQAGRPSEFITVWW